MDSISTVAKGLRFQRVCGFKRIGLGFSSVLDLGSQRVLDYGFKKDLGLRFHRYWIVVLIGTGSRFS